MNWLLTIGAVVLTDLFWLVVGGVVGLLSVWAAVEVTVRTRQSNHLNAGMMTVWFSTPLGAGLSVAASVLCQLIWGPTSMDALYTRVLVCGSFNLLMGAFFFYKMVNFGQPQEEPKEDRTPKNKKKAM